MMKIIQYFGGRKMFYGFYVHAVATILLVLRYIPADDYMYIVLGVYGIMAGTNTVTTAMTIGKDK